MEMFVKFGRRNNVFKEDTEVISHNMDLLSSLQSSSHLFRRE